MSGTLFGPRNQFLQTLWEIKNDSIHSTIAAGTFGILRLSRTNLSLRLSFDNLLRTAPQQCELAKIILHVVKETDNEEVLFKHSMVEVFDI